MFPEQLVQVLGIMFALPFNALDVDSSLHGGCVVCSDDMKSEVALACCVYRLVWCASK